MRHARLRIRSNLVILMVLLAASARAGESSTATDGWQTAAPRDELRPRFVYTAKGGRDGKGTFGIMHDQRKGLDGYWTRTFSVQGGRFYRFHTVRKISAVRVPRRSAVVRIS